MSISDAIALVAIVISLVSLLLQKSDINKQLLVSNFSEYTRRYQELIEKIPSNVLDQDFDLFSLSSNDREIILRYMLIYFDLCYEEYFLYREGLIPKRLWKAWEEGINVSLSRPAFRQSWMIINSQASYSNALGFVDFIGTVLKKR